jgi:hypothetical protein
MPRPVHRGRSFWVWKVKTLIFVDSGGGQGFASAAWFSPRNDERFPPWPVSGDLF